IAKALGNLKVEGTSTLNYIKASSNLVDEEQKEGSNDGKFVLVGDDGELIKPSKSKLPMQKEAAVTSTCEPSTTMEKQHISAPSTSMGDKGEESKDEFDVYDGYEDQVLDLSDEHIYFVMLMISVSEAKIGRSASYRFYLQFLVGSLDWHVSLMIGRRRPNIVIDRDEIDIAIVFLTDVLTLSELLEIGRRNLYALLDPEGE
ncbi:hypothetical protein Tco_0681881, partial [Tanacetum coccineum]